MPIISRIGAKSLKVRAVYGFIFLVLTLGAMTMIYPFLLMLSGSFNSEADATYITPYPRFLFEDDILFHKYIESKYNSSYEQAESAWGDKIIAWRNIHFFSTEDGTLLKIGAKRDSSKPIGVANHNDPLLKDYLEWREIFLKDPANRPYWHLGHVNVGRLYPKNARLWRQEMFRQFDDDVDAFRERYGLPVKSWDAVRPPPLSAVRFPITNDYRREFDIFSDGRPVADKIITNLDGSFRQSSLMPRYTSDIKHYNQTHGTDYTSYQQVFLTERIPGSVQVSTDWREFLTSEFGASLRVSTQPAESQPVPRSDQVLAEEKHLDGFISLLKEKFKDNVADLNKKHKTDFASFDDIRKRAIANRERNSRHVVIPAALRDYVNEFVIKQWQSFLERKYNNDITALAKAHAIAPEPGQQPTFQKAAYIQVVREDWERFVREKIKVVYVLMDESLSPCYRQFLKARWTREGSPHALSVADALADLNKKYDTNYRSFDDIPFSTAVPLVKGDRTSPQTDWGAFLSDVKECPVEMLRVYGPRQMFDEFRVSKHGIAAISESLNLPIAQADYMDAMSMTSDLRWEFSGRNYKYVLEYILLHGRGIMNTLIYVILAIGTALLVNPLAAYALSRYKPRSTYKILLFCMATMAFPGEVTMIPAFLLMRKFPLWGIVGGVIAFFVVLWLLSKVLPKVSEILRMTLALGVALFIGVGVIPMMMGRSMNVSLLNTFAALVLPHMANGFFIFLLKGFFDSLPRELYEAASLDGAGEWTKFWTITMNLSKPILAVIALDAFTAAYSAFMMALIIIPDQNMWTLMVWIFQLQSQAHQGVVYASLVIAAIPTLLVFTLCQNIIIRGIVVPTEK